MADDLSEKQPHPSVRFHTTEDVAHGLTDVRVTYKRHGECWFSAGDLTMPPDVAAVLLRMVDHFDGAPAAALSASRSGPDE